MTKIVDLSSMSEVMEYGEAPVTVLSDDISKKLDEEYQNGELKKTGVTFKINGREYNEVANDEIKWVKMGDKYVAVEPLKKFEGIIDMPEEDNQKHM